MQDPAPRFRDPNFGAPADLEAHLRLVAPGAAARGMFFNDLVQLARAAAPHVDVLALAGLPARRFMTFLEYPFAEGLRLMAKTAEVVHPTVPRGEGLRRLGHRAYDTLLDSHAGRVIFGAMGLDVESVIRFGPKGYRLTLNFGKVSSTRVGERHFVYTYDGVPAFLEHYHVGVVEGALQHYGQTARVKVAMRDLAHATFDVAW